MNIKLAVLVLLASCLSGCLTWDIDQQEVANAAAAGAGAAAVDAVADAVADDDEEAAEAEPEPEPVPRKGYVPDPANPMSGPKTTEHIQSDDPAYAPVYPDGVNAPQAPSGGIYNTSMGDVFFGDQTASKVGDILTINLNESTTSTKANTAAISKTASATIPDPKVLGQTLNMDTDVPAQTTNFSGNASADQNNSLAGIITVTVYRVYPNGLMAVRGEKWLKLNQGNEYLRFTGVVRKRDIAPDNTVDSERVADARITYSGTGEVAAGSEQGWVSRLLNSRDMPN
ncbi:flagellar basal body L-ring protein FlgH [Marinomonas pollencensis]|uniref:Flagellar L-ring protein n=1 Tax=Marinomonas pollencensis TaxID=491954 RepID=A0A3E0DPH3_9GAMM|nr:flagellar basal body L-ring protein FlgH [Marinomonas pollencensis]REG84856.1 flagellar L-ring protein precursor FlgH [Marinomonas pollencensis]